jgi:hypothetical protein
MLYIVPPISPHKMQKQELTPPHYLVIQLEYETIDDSQAILIYLKMFTFFKYVQFTQK